MSIRLDPRRLSALKLLAAEAGIRPGELVTRWVEERLDAARPGSRPPSEAAPEGLAALVARLDELTRRVDALGTAPAAGKASPAAEKPTQVAEVAEEPTAPVKRGPGRPRKVVVADAEAPAAAAPKRAARKAAGKAGKAAKRARAPMAKAAPRGLALHDEIAAVIAERGPQTAAELAAAIIERGTYAPPRSSKLLDAAIVNARVSNPKYRPRFLRREGRIGLAAE